MRFTLPKPGVKNTTITLVALLCLALYAAGLWYIGHLEREVKQQARDLAFETRREASLRTLGGFLEDVREDSAELSSFFAAPEAAVAVIEQVEGLGDLVGVSVVISGVHIVDEIEDTGEGTLVMDVAAEGPWANVLSLARLLDTFPFASHIDEMSFRRSAPKEDGTMSWSLRATMYLLLRR